MPEHVLMSGIEIITDGGRRRRWTAAEKLRIVEEALDDRASISVVARRTGVAPNLLYRWRRLMLERGVLPWPRMMTSPATRLCDSWRTASANLSASMVAPLVGADMLMRSCGRPWTSHG